MSARYRSIESLYCDPHLNFYHMDAVTEAGRSFDYYFVSRNEPEHIKARTGELRAEGVVIYALLKSDPEKILLIRQYRYPVGGYIYELPAGLVEAGEEAEAAAARELLEETGYRFQPVRGDEAFSRPFYMGAGYTDEACSAVFGWAEGDGSLRAPEDTESIEVIVADKEEVRRILREERVSQRMAYLCMNFLTAKAGEPFAFIGA